MSEKQREASAGEGVFGCAWHQKLTGQPMAFDAATGCPLPDYPYDDTVTHGICRECLERVRSSKTPPYGARPRRRSRGKGRQ